MSTENLQKAFESPLYSFGQSENILVFLEQVFDDNADLSQGFLSSYMLNNSYSIVDSVSEELTAIYQIDIVMPSKLGTAKINAMIDKLRAIFYNGSHHNHKDSCFSVTNMAVTGNIEDGGFIKKSVSLSVSGYTKKL